MPLRLREPGRRAGRALFLIVGFCWVIAALVGLSVLWAYETGPGDAKFAPERPPASRLRPEPQRPTLIAVVYSSDDLHHDFF